MTFATSSPGASQGGQGSTPPICQNCTTSTTPLWRRDESGSVLCNACGLFLKLHGRPRPISLKTDVIKSRNRQKASGQPVKKKASLFDSPNQGAMTEGDSPPMHYRSRPSHKHESVNGSASPHSRHGTPLPQHSHIPPSSFFDSIISADGAMMGSPSLPALHLNQPSPGSSSSQLDRQPDLPQTYDALLALNKHLKTRVSELEVVNDIFRTRVSELENSEANARRSEITRREIEAQLRICLDEGQKREDSLKRKCQDLESELHEAREQNAHQRKKVRVSDLVSLEDTSTPSTPQSSS